MTNLLHEAYTGLLSGIYHYKPGTKEIVIDKPNNRKMTRNKQLTVELLDINKQRWVYRGYYKSGNIKFKITIDGDRELKHTSYREDGTIWMESINGKPTRTYFGDKHEADND